MWASGVKTAGGDTVVDRGDPAANDWWIGSGITCDDTERELDCSGICPAGTKEILFQIRIKGPSASSIFQMKHPDNTNWKNIADVTNTVAAEPTISDRWVECDADRKVSYYATTSLTTATVNIRKYITG